MRASRFRVAAFVAGVIAASGALAQSGLPTIIQLPTDDFVYTWGKDASVDKRSRPEFTVRGVEQRFQCMLTGSFKTGSRMRDFYNLREFEQSLSATIYFIQDATSRLNDLYLSNDVDWAILDCIIPETIEDEDKRQEKIDKALERAERDRERRRARAADSED